MSAAHESGFPQDMPWLSTLHEVGTGSAGLPRESWEEEYAYTLGVQAYVYGFPWIYLSQLRWLWTAEAGKAC
jgi:hypothetical protein